MKKGRPRPIGFHALVYGTPTVGKTTLLSQMPKPAALLDIEGGSGWLYCERDLKGLDVFHIEESDDPAAAVEAFLRAAVQRKPEVSSYKSIGVDTVAALRARHLTKLTSGNLHIEQGDYGRATTWLRRVLVMTQFAPQIILWTTHAKEVQDGPRMVLRPSGMSDTALDHCNELLDAIIFMGKNTKGGEPFRYMTTDDVDPVQGKAAIWAKDRTGLLPGVLEIDDLSEKGEPPDMFSPFFEEVLKEIRKSNPDARLSAQKSQPTKKGR